MFRHIFNQILFRTKPNKLFNENTPLLIPKVNMMKCPKDHHETTDEFVDRMECYFNRPDIDGWELRKGLNDLAGMDLIPEPKIILAALCACRRCNDYACTTRLLEMIKFKCGPKAESIYPYLLEHIEPALKELGIETPEKMGYGEPELWLENVHDMY